MKRHTKIVAGVVTAVIVLGGAGYMATASPHGGFCRIGGGHWGHHSEWTEEDMKDHSEFFVKRFAKKIDATDEQKAAIQKTVDEAIPRMLELRAKKKEVHKNLHAALSAEKVDKAKLEQARKDGVKLADEMSKIVLDSTVSLSDILTAEQRKELVERFSHMKGKRH